ncbi:MAG: M1 family metallopeptidase [Pseudomonadota bacterium]
MFEHIRMIAVLTMLLVLAGCSREQPASEAEPTADAPAKVTDTGPVPGRDYHSFANADEYRTTNLDLDLDVDFSRKVIDGVATLDFERLTEANPALVLDTRDLTINSVSAGTEGDMQEATFRLRAPAKILGSALEIDLPADATRVAIDYTTSPGASGLQWLEPRQTAGKRHPFLFSQAQAIHARSFVPLQDTPGVRMPYTATVRTPPELLALMSADNDPQAEKDGEYQFTMRQPIPSYLLAIAVGDIEFKAMGDRTGVYAEREILDAAAAEFEDTEAMLETTEARYGPYRWERYDLLILPPSFPFGGMENPRLSFITPTVIAGDKSLVALIAHELAHSWSGNLVTNASWRDLWMNEGFTTYLTNRIMQFVFGDERYAMELALGYADLVDELDALPDADEMLALDVRGRDPDEAFSNIPYDKGALFLYEIEQRIGREAFDVFLAEYFDKYAFQSLNTEDFVAHIQTTLLADHADVLDAARINQWLYEPGLPDGAPTPQSDAFSKLDPLRDAWLSGDTQASSIDTDDWTFHQWKYFLDGMPEQLTDAQLSQLDEAFGLTASRNNEIAFSWLRIAIRNDYSPAEARLENFLMSIGRNKFLRPLYQDLVDAGKRETAIRIFEAAKPGYHPLTVKRNSQILYATEN